MGFEEMQHTADWAMRVWAQDMPSLFAEAARGLNTLAHVELAQGPRERRRFECAAPDGESLLVAFLSELVYYQEQEGLAFEDFQIHIEDGRLRVAMQGAALRSIGKAIKAVTYHNLKIQKSERGYEAEIVLDV